jgi:hypothetical protein
MARNNIIHPYFKWRFESDDRRQAEKALSEKINYISSTSPELTGELRDKVEVYAGLLESNGLKDANIARKLDYGWLRYFALIAGFPVYVAGVLSNLLPFIVPRTLCSKLIRDPRFYSSFYITSGTLLYLIYFPLVMILAGVFAGLTGLMLTLLVPIAGYLALFYQETAKERFHTFRYWWKKGTDRSLVSDLFKQRSEIQEMVKKINPS